MRRWSDKSIVSIPKENSERLDANILSISLHELPEIRVGLKIVGSKLSVISDKTSNLNFCI